MSFLEQLMPAAGFVTRHVAGLAVIAASSWVFGEALLGRIGVDRAARRAALAGALGLGVIAQAMFFLGVADRLDRGVVLALLVLAHLACLRTWSSAFRSWRSPRRRRVAGWWLALGGPVFACFFWLALYPPTGFDATLYHLPYARAFVASGSLPFLPDLRFPVFPQAAEIGFVLAFFLAGDVAAKLTQLLALLLTAGLLLAWGRRLFSRQAGLLAAALWLGNPLAVWVGTSAYVDASLALFVTAALYAWERWSDSADRRWLVLAGAFAGWAAATKYLGLFFLAALALLTAARGLRARDLRPLATLLAVAVVVLAPWYLRIVYHTQNPVFPLYAPIFGGSEWAIDVQASAPAADGAEAGNAWDVVERQASRVADGLGFLLRVPWTAVFDRGVFHWQAPLSPLYLVLVPLCAPLALFDARSRRLVLLMAVYGLFWLTTFRELRFFLACAPAFDLALAATLARGAALAAASWRRAAVSLAAALLISPGLFWAGHKIRERGRLPVTVEQRAAYLERTVPGVAAIHTLNRRHGSAYVVYVLYGENLRYYAEGRFLGDWFGPARFSRVAAVLGDGRLLHRELRGLGACHFLIRHRRPQTLLPADDFFRRHFELLSRGADHALYRLTSEDCPRAPP